MQVLHTIHIVSRNVLCINNQNEYEFASQLICHEMAIIIFRRYGWVWPRRGLVVRALASCLVGRCSRGSNLGQDLTSVWPSARQKQGNSPMRMQSSSESGRVAYLPSHLNKSDSDFHRNNFVEKWTISSTVEGQFLCCAVTLSQLRCVRTFREMFSCLRRSDRRGSDGMGHVLCGWVYSI